MQDNINVEVIVCEGMDWIHLAQLSFQSRVLLSTIMKLRVP
jgi:hypothetical protein